MGQRCQPLAAFLWRIAAPFGQGNPEPLGFATQVVGAHASLTSCSRYAWIA
jgi:hypothetical protein